MPRAAVCNLQPAHRRRLLLRARPLLETGATSLDDVRNVVRKRDYVYHIPMLSGDSLLGPQRCLMLTVASPTCTSNVSEVWLHVPTSVLLTIRPDSGSFKICRCPIPRRHPCPRIILLPPYVLRLEGDTLQYRVIGCPLRHNLLLFRNWLH